MILMLSTLFSISNSDVVDLDMSYEEVISLKILEIESQESINHNIQYSEFAQAKQEAIDEDKLIMIKVEAENCKSCERLNALLDSNDNIKEMVNRHIKAVKIDTNYESLPDGLHSIGTPTLFLINPKDEDRVMMKLVGNDAIEELEESLELIVNDSYEEELVSM